MIELLAEEITKTGCKFRIVPVERLGMLKSEIDGFAAGEELNGFQKFIVEKLYAYGSDSPGFTARSVILLAAPAPAYAKVEFTWRGAKVATLSLVRAAIGGELAAGAMLGRLNKLLASRGYHIAPAPAVPLKRLAARSGLARYGRNNVTYIEGLGSFFNYASYFADVPCEEGEWAELRVADRCEGCRVCQNLCPTKAIRPNRFLIDCERCLSYFNEGPGEFPDWIPPSAHHCVYDCLKCQVHCPMNEEYVKNVAGPVGFDEEETGLLLAGSDARMFSWELRKKLELLGMDQWLPAIPRNLNMLLSAGTAKAEGALWNP